MKKTLLLGCLLVSLLIPQTASAGEGAQQIVKIAQQELKRGVVEKPYGSNRGPRIRMYGLATTPRLYPAPWCAYFASWVTRQAGLPIGPGGRGLGYVPYIQAWAKKTKKWRSSPRAGDLITFPHHVGIVERVYSNRTLTTIEGNTSERIRRRGHRWSDASGYVRVDNSRVSDTH